MLKQIHDDLDAAVCEAYGWPHDLTGEEILQRLVDLNHERAAEEAQGKIRRLRRDCQNPDGQADTQGQLIDKTPQKKPAAAKPAAKTKWPATLPERTTAVREALSQQAGPVDVSAISGCFTGGRNRAAAVGELLETLVAVGQARQLDDGRYAI